MSESTQANLEPKAKADAQQQIITRQYAGLNITEKDIRDFCELAKLPPVILEGTLRRYQKKDQKIAYSDVVIMLWQTQQNGLPVGGPWFDLIPAQNGQGFTLYFKKEAAEYILTHSPRVVQPIVYWWEMSDGTKHDETDPPSFLDSKGKIGAIDWNMRCVLKVTLKDDEGKPFPVSVGERYRSWARNTDYPTSPWIFSAGRMLLKQCKRICVQEFLGPSLEFEDDISPVPMQRVHPEPQKLLEPSPANVTTVDVESQPIPQEIKTPDVGVDPLTPGQTEAIKSHAIRLGLLPESLLAGARECATSGGDVGEFIASLDKNKRGV